MVSYLQAFAPLLVFWGVMATIWLIFTIAARVGGQGDDDE